IDVPSLIERLASGELDARSEQRPDGAVPTPEGFPPTRRRPAIRGRPAQPADELIRALGELARRAAVTPCKPLDVGAVALALRAALVPDVAIPPRVLAQITLPSTRVHLSARLDPILAAPEIPT